MHEDFLAPCPVSGMSWRGYVEHCVTHDPLPCRETYAITEDDARLLRGVPAPLKILVPVTIENSPCPS